MDIVTDIMCRKLKLKYKKDVEHDGINTLLGRHGDVMVTKTSKFLAMNVTSCAIKAIMPEFPD